MPRMLRSPGRGPTIARFRGVRPTLVGRAVKGRTSVASIADARLGSRAESDPESGAPDESPSAGPEPDKTRAKFGIFGMEGLAGHAGTASSAMGSGRETVGGAGGKDR